MKGKRCRISKLAIKRGINRNKDKMRLGTITSVSKKYPHCYNVLWDGLKYMQTYAKDYIEIV